jgi:cytidylate kinase
MANNTTLNFQNITVSGKIASGTSTLAKNLVEVLNWQYVNTGALQREFDRKHGIHENMQGAVMRPDERERKMEAMAQKKLETEKNLVYEGWLSGFVARKLKSTLRVLLYCSEDAVRIDRVVNRDGITVDEAKIWIKQREQQNIEKWQKLYGPYNFWDPKYYTLAIDTFSSGSMETLGKVLDKLGFNGKINGVIGGK